MPLSETVIIHGLGTEGRAALGYFGGLHPRPQICIIAPQAELSAHRDMTEGNLPVAEEEIAAGGPFPAAPERGVLYLRSPGIPPDNPVHSRAAAAGFAITTPTGYWLQHLAPQRTLTITGTKGKSTATALAAHILNACGIPARAVGNIGVHPLAQRIGAHETAIVELSSYMLMDCPVAASVHVVTNIFREHTDWHGGQEPYAAAKLRPYALDAACTAVIPGALAPRLADLANPQTIYDQAVLIEDEMRIQMNGGDVVLPLGEPRFALPPLKSALQAALAAVLAAGFVTVESLKQHLLPALADWQGLPARQEMIGRYAGRLWVNDALATIPEAVLMAVEAWRGGDVRLVLGGKDRGQNWAPFATRMAEAAGVTLYTFGPVEAAVLHAFDALPGGRPAGVRPSGDFKTALASAFRDSAPGSVMLFSPGAASSAPFADYRARGAAFAQFARAQEGHSA